MKKLVKSPLNYIGGKYKLLPQLLPLFPNMTGGGRFIDLFCGGANVAVNVDAKSIIANDISTEIIDIYKTLQKFNIDEILRYIDSRITEYELTLINQEGYNSFRINYNESQQKNPLDLFILICFSFNHQIRFNKNGEFNMPFGKDRSYFNETIRQNLIDFKKGIENISFTNRTFEELDVEKLKKDDFVYCDPPYLITCATYNEKDGWNEDKEKKLLKLLDRINEKGIKYALSNVLSNKGKENEILMQWSNKYKIYHLNNSYGNCNYHTKDKDSKPDEVLIVNY